MFLKKASKIFCIGFNKTGTTSLEKVLKDLGYKMGDQPLAELMIDDWGIKDFSKLKKFCKTADAFQDIPFSYPYTYIYLDQIFKNSKFILTIRDSDEQWYQSIVAFHGKLWANENIPSKKDLLNAPYRYKGFAYKAMKFLYNTPDDDIYNKQILTNEYNRHNENAINYFRYRPKDLLVLNVKEKNSYKKLCSFLGKNPLYEAFPWENKTN